MQSERATVLVTGGAGFIGSHSVDLLLQLGHRVRVLDDFSTGRAEHLTPHPDLDILHGDIRHAADVQHAMQGVSHVLHLAAQVSVAASLETPLASASRNLLGFVNVLDRARQAGIARLVYASSAAVYGNPAILPICETSPLRPMSPYGLEKQVNEQYAALYAEHYGLASLGLRYFNVYGPRQDRQSPYSGVVTRFIEQAKETATITVYGDGEQTRDLIHVRDIAQANARALFSSHCGVVNVGTGQACSIRTLARYIQQLIPQDVRCQHVANRAGDIRDSRADVARLHDWLGTFAPVDLQHGLAELIATQD